MAHMSMCCCLLFPSSNCMRIGDCFSVAALCNLFDYLMHTPTSYPPPVALKHAVIMDCTDANRAEPQIDLVPPTARISQGRFHIIEHVHGHHLQTRMEWPTAEELPRHLYHANCARNIQAWTWSDGGQYETSTHSEYLNHNAFSHKETPGIFFRFTRHI
jgi:hypothetical protein